MTMTRFEKLKTIMQIKEPLKSLSNCRKGMEVFFVDPDFSGINFGWVENVNVWEGEITIEREFTTKHSDKLFTTTLDKTNVYDYNSFDVNYCTCGARHTTNPKWHLTYCYYSKT